MTPDDPEDYIRRLERGVGDTPEAAPQPSRSGETLQQRLIRLAKFANTTWGRVILIGAIPAAFALLFFVAHNAGTTVHGNLIMINSGAKDKIDCNNGNVKLDGDNNTYTITGHCRRLEISGGANHVAVDGVDTISILGDDNVVIYRFGSPTINKTGNNNIVTQRLERP
ncbi:DUF3060 domain-containing protein [Mycobacterium sp. Marseille-P9652]|uniref:DUF3060 domain-containing protein n=1 Tax=Mycobacterium sp. Marseille-P9652 TaxID=2654950 RepID=UPI0012E91BD3|nr:DUF3060 domain-containing protein [Mycobacterium sp. Marseille-P9652]